MKPIENCTHYMEALTNINEAINFWEEKLTEKKEKDIDGIAECKEWLAYWKGMRQGIETLKIIMKKNPYAIS